MFNRYLQIMSTRLIRIQNIYTGDSFLAAAIQFLKIKITPMTTTATTEKAANRASSAFCSGV